MLKVMKLQWMAAVALLCLLPMQAHAVQTKGIATIAGGGTPIAPLIGDGGLATQALLVAPKAVAFDIYGNVYIAETNKPRIRKVDAVTGNISTIAGTSTYGYLGDGGLATAASLGVIVDIEVASNGDIYLLDTSFNVIRKIAASTGIITTLVGNGQTGNTGDYGNGTLAKLRTPKGIALEPAGNFLYIADTGNHRIRRLSLTNNAIGPVSDAAGLAGYAGDGNVIGFAKFSSPTGIVFDTNGDYYIVDSGNYRIRKVTSFGSVSTVAGTGTRGRAGEGDNASATAALFSLISTIAVDSYANIYVSDQVQLRKIDATSGVISTIAGSEIIRNSGDGGPSPLAQFMDISDVAVDGLGNIYIVDRNAARVRKIFADFVPPSAPVVTSLTGVRNSWGGLTGTADNYSIVKYTHSNTVFDQATIRSFTTPTWALNITSVSEQTEGAHTVTIYATDEAGNQSTYVDVNYIVDQTPPVITLIGANPLSVPEGIYNDPGATALDAVAGDVTASITSGGPNVFGTLNLQDGQMVTAGETYSIVYVAVDSVGNFNYINNGAVIRTVTVTAVGGGSGDSSAGGDSGGGGCLAPMPIVSWASLLPMFGLLMMGLYGVRRKEE